MIVRKLTVAVLLPLLLSLNACSKADETAHVADEPQVSGLIIGGLRVLTIDPAAPNQDYTIYRGDYVRFAMPDSQTFTLEIPELKLSKTFPAPEGERPFVKFPNEGRFPYSTGSASGVIEALEYRAAAYREVDALEARDLIANLKPVVLDVRTKGEYTDGHLPDAWLIPVQELQSRLHELAGHKDEPVFIYCRSGNRSTVGAKVLVDAGFSQVINLRHGIVDWARNDLPVIR
jgi:rhodanese-related sulfurtransferase